jgi:hypothetical protein
MDLSHNDLSDYKKSATKIGEFFGSNGTITNLNLSSCQLDPYLRKILKIFLNIKFS